MTLAKSVSADTVRIGDRDSNVSDQQRMTLHRVHRLANQSIDYMLNLWNSYQPVITDKAQATWRLLHNTQPVQLLLVAALAVLSIALVNLVTTFSGLIILLLKVAALTLAAVAVGQWLSLGLSWADGKLPSAPPKEKD